MAPIALSAVITAIASYQLLSSGTFTKLITVLETLDFASRLSILTFFISFIVITSSVFESMNESSTTSSSIATKPASAVAAVDAGDGTVEGETKEGNDERKVEVPIVEEPMVVATTALSSSISYPLDAISQAKDDKEKFLAMYPMLRDEMLTHMKGNEMPEEALAWCKEMMDYNVPGGKLNRGLTVVAVQRTLIQSKYHRDLTDLEFARASVLGWALEFLQAFFLVADDIMDDSQTRRGQPCWYKLPKVGNIAINDSFLLESYVFTMIRIHFGGDTFYHPLVELYLQVIQQTEFGQLLDLTSQPHGSKKVNLDRFTLDRYKLIVKYKTAFYTFYLPVAIGMITSGTTDKESLEYAQSICCIMGEYFQIQDDVLDCYGEPAQIGKSKYLEFRLVHME